MEAVDIRGVPRGLSASLDLSVYALDVRDVVPKLGQPVPLDVVLNDGRPRVPREASSHPCGDAVARELRLKDVDTFQLTESGNSEILCKWLVMAIENGYEAVFDKSDQFLGSIGRMKYLKPMYKALSENPKSEALASKIFDKHKGMYHPIARGGLENILGVKA